VVPGPWEVIVADNGSVDDTRAVAEAWADRLPLRIVDASARAGVSAARNAGARAATGDRVLFCDADDEVAPGWVALLAAGLNDHHAVGGRLDRRRFTEERYRRAGLVESDALTPWPGYLPFASGANCGFRSGVLTELGGFDEDLVGGGDDVELSWRVHLAGYTLGFVPEAVVHYRERTHGWAAARQFYRYGRQDPHLYRRFSAHGMPGSGLAAGLRSWVHLVVQAPTYLRTPAGRAQWVRSASRRAGRLVGSVAHRSVYL
jgi:GT2 family glycosyltransferase